MNGLIVNIETNVYYGSGNLPRIMALTWNDGVNGVRYVIEGTKSFIPLVTSKRGFLGMLKQG